jgi:hypothetical protein
MLTVRVFRTKLHFSDGRLRTTEGAYSSIQRAHDLNTHITQKNTDFLYIINVQQDATTSSLYFILLQYRFTCFRCLLHPSSGGHKTVVTTTGTSHVSRWRDRWNPLNSVIGRAATYFDVTILELVGMARVTSCLLLHLVRHLSYSFMMHGTMNIKNRLPCFH